MRTALPSEKTGLLGFLRPRPPEPTIRVLPTETIGEPHYPEDVLRQMINLGSLMKEKSLRAEFARSGALYNACPQCGANLEQVTVDGIPLLGCPSRNDAQHRTGVMRKLQAEPIDPPLPVYARVAQEATRIARERSAEIDTFFRRRQSFLRGKFAQSGTPAPAVLTIEPPRLPHLTQDERRIEPQIEADPVEEQVFTVDAIIEEISPVEPLPSALEEIGILAENIPSDDTLEVPLIVRDKILARIAREQEQQEG